MQDTEMKTLVDTGRKRRETERAYVMTVLLCGVIGKTNGRYYGVGYDSGRNKTITVDMLTA